MSVLEYLGAKRPNCSRRPPLPDSKPGNLIMIVIGICLHLPGDRQALRAAAAGADRIRNHRRQHPVGGRHVTERLRRRHAC